MHNIEKDVRLKETYDKNMKAIRCETTKKKIRKAVIPETWELGENRSEGEQVYHNLLIDGKPYYENVNSFIMDCRRDIAKQGGYGHRTVIFTGVGLGYHVYSFLTHKRYSQEYINLVLVDPDPAMVKVMLHTLDISEVLKTRSVMFIIGRDEVDLRHQLSETFMQNFTFRHAISCSNVYNYPPYYEKERAYFDNFYKVWKERLDYNILSYGTSINDGLEGFFNSMDSIGYLVRNRGFSSLFGKFKNKPGIMVAAGPSLSKNMHLLKDVGDKAVIIAVDSALKPMLQQGIIPHIVTTIERGTGPINYYTDLEAYCDIKDLRKKMTFAPAAVIHKSVYDLVCGQYNIPTFTVFRDFSDFKWTEMKKGIIKSGKSSANLGFQMLSLMGCAPAVLVGQDLAFAEDGETHVKGSDHSSEGMKKSPKMNQERWVKGNNGKMIRTLEVWEHFLRDYEVDIQRFKGTVINATEGGAYIAGTKCMTLEKAIKNNMRTVFNPIEKIVDICLETKEDLESAKKVFLQKIDTTLAYKIDLVKRCRKLIQDAHSIIDDVKKLKSMTEHMDPSRIIQLKKDYLRARDGNMFFEFIVHSVQSHLNTSEIRMNEIGIMHQSNAERIAALAITIKATAGIIIVTAEKKMESILEAKVIVEAMDD